MDGKMLSRRHRPTDARMEKTLNDDDDINLILPINIVCMLWSGLRFTNPRNVDISCSYIYKIWQKLDALITARFVFEPEQVELV